MTKSEFNNLIKKDSYQVFVFLSRASMPFFFGVHPWFVINKKGQITRMEIKHYLNPEKTGYLHTNTYLPYEGMPIIHPFKKFLWNIQILGSTEGDENSLAKRMIDFIESSKDTYPYNKKYLLFPGPNCGTYVEWVLEHFPGFKMKLPWASFGKDFK